MGIVLTGTGQTRRERYTSLLEGLRESRDWGRLAGALELLPGVVEEVVEDKVKVLEARLKSIEARLDGVEHGLDELRDAVNEFGEEVAGARRVAESARSLLGGLAEAVLSRFFVEELAGRGYRLVSVERNAVVNGEDIDIVVVAEREGRREHFVVEVKVRPKHSDVGGLLAKAELYGAVRGVEPRPVLAGVWVGREVEEYARGKGVLVFKL